VDVETLRDLSVNLFEEVEEFGGPVPLVAFANDKAGGEASAGVERSVRSITAAT